MSDLISLSATSGSELVPMPTSEVGSGRSKLWELVSDRVSMGMELASNDVVPIIGTDVWSRISGDETIVDKLLASTL